MDNAQKLLKKNNSKIVGCLKEAIDGKDLKHIGEVFIGLHGRLFFDIGASADLTKTLQNHTLLARFDKKLEQWQPVVNEENIDYLNDLVEYFFQPIEQSKEWQAFWKQQKTIIPKKKQQEIRDQIAVAVTYKIQCLWAIQNPVKMEDKNQVDKVSCFTLWIHALINDEIEERQRQKTKRVIANAVADFRMGLLSRGEAGARVLILSKKDIYPQLMRHIRDIRSNIHFKALAEGEEMLQGELLKLMDDALFESKKPKSKIDKYVVKKIAEAILMDINAQHLVRFSTGKTPDYLMSSLGKAEPLIGSKVKEKCVRLLKNYKIKKYQASKASSRPRGKNAEREPLLPSFFHNSSTSKKETKQERKSRGKNLGL